jgi:hypothetical protein
MSLGLSNRAGVFFRVASVLLLAAVVLDAFKNAEILVGVTIALLAILLMATPII